MNGLTSAPLGVCRRGLGSFKAAAAELNITPSAISQQLKAIEDALGIMLFERRGRLIRLTAAGAVYLRDTQRLLSELAAATRRVLQQPAGRVLRLSTSDFIAYEFLLPRLSLFRARFPGLELNLDVTPRVVDFATTDVDVAIRIADGTWTGLVSQGIGDAWVAPVCSRQLASEITSITKLREQTLIELRGQESRSWKVFMKKQRVRDPERLHVLAFDTYLETIRAAEQGLGVAFGVFPLTTSWVTSGRLAVPLRVRIPFTGRIRCIYRKADERDRLYGDFAAWLREQHAELSGLASGRVVQHPPPADLGGASGRPTRRKP